MAILVMRHSASLANHAQGRKGLCKIGHRLNDMYYLHCAVPMLQVMDIHVLIHSISLHRVVQTLIITHLHCLSVSMLQVMHILIFSSFLYRVALTLATD